MGILEKLIMALLKKRYAATIKAMRNDTALQQSIKRLGDAVRDFERRADKVQEVSMSSGVAGYSGNAFRKKKIREASNVLGPGYKLTLHKKVNTDTYEFYSKGNDYVVIKNGKINRLNRTNWVKLKDTLDKI